MKTGSAAFVAVLAALAAGEAAGQTSELSAPCARPEVPADAREFCLTVAQAAESTQPRLGIAIAGGNPTLGAVSAGGLRMGVLPRASATLKANLTFLRVPDLLAAEAGGTVQRLNQSLGVPIPALSGSASIGVFPGVSLVPMVGGIGAIDLLATATWLPLTLLDDQNAFRRTSGLAYGGGVRLGLLRESFLTPGVSASLMYRRLGEVQLGDVCPLDVGSFGIRSQEHTVRVGSCLARGDAGEFAMDLSTWSARAMVGKQLAGLGAAVGVGYDHVSSNLAFGFRAPEGSIPAIAGYYARVEGLDMDNGRLSAFANASLRFLVATIAVEAGWQAGDEAIPSFEEANSDFDPEEGAFFGSFGVRLAL